MNRFYPLPVLEIARETPSAVSITFDVPKDLQTIFKFKAGQYITIKHEVNGKEIRRAYSLCSSPKSGILKIGVKEIKGGTFSVFANQHLKKGDLLEVMPPQGLFTFEPQPNLSNAYASFVAGSGITPVLSIIQCALEEEPQSKFLLVYGNKNRAETMFYNTLIELQEKYPTRFFLELVYSREDVEGALFGRIETATVNYFTKNKYNHIAFKKYYVCGPEAMIHCVKDTLTANGVAKENILFELFTTPEEENNIEIPEGTTQLTVVLDEETHTLMMPHTKSVLDAVLEKDIDAPYSCRGGVCSTCIAKVKAGNAVMKKNQILTDQEIEAGFILTCQAYPTSDTLKIDYDDV